MSADMLFQQLREHVREPEHRIYWRAVWTCHWRQRMESAEYEARPINQNQVEGMRGTVVRPIGG
jgi:hypothetical protein